MMIMMHSLCKPFVFSSCTFCFFATLVHGSQQWQEVYERFIDTIKNHPIEVVFAGTKEEDIKELYNRYCYDFVHELSLRGTNEDCAKV